MNVPLAIEIFLSAFGVAGDDVDLNAALRDRSKNFSMKKCGEIGGLILCE